MVQNVVTNLQLEESTHTAVIATVIGCRSLSAYIITHFSTAKDTPGNYTKLAIAYSTTDA